MATHRMIKLAPVATEAKQEAGEDLSSVQALAASGIEVVPPRFIRPEQELASFCPHSTLCFEPIPTIDLEGLQDFRRQFTMAAISSACYHWGCFQIVNHEIPQSILDDALGAAREFFEMPSEEKQAYKMDLSTPNASGYGMQSSETKDKVLDWGDVMFHKNMDRWPAKPATYKNAMDAYARETRKVLESLLDVISKELRLVPTYFRNDFGDFEQPLRVNYYPPCPQPELVLGLRTHTDPIVLTALLEDQTRGLQVKNGDKWVSVDPEPDALVIFVGDQLQISSNGRCKAVSHRVVVNKKTARISIAMGLAPNPKAQVRPAPQLVDKSATARYESRTYGEFRASLLNGVRWYDSFRHLSSAQEFVKHRLLRPWIALKFADMGKFFKDSYASTYAAKNVKNALDKLIDVLQSPEQVQKLVIGPAPRKPHVKPAKISFEAPAKTPLWMETSASMAKHTRNAGHSEKQNTITPSSSDNLSDKKKTSSGGSRASECSTDSSGHIPTGRHTQMWTKSLREYPVLGGSVRPARYRQPIAPPQLEAGWSSVPCKSGDFNFEC